MTILYTHEDCLAHNPGEGHPERPARLEAIVSALDAPEFAALDRRAAPMVDRAHLEWVHPAAFVDMVLGSVPSSGHALLDADTVLSAGSDRAALRAAGAVVAAVEAVCRGEAKTAF